MSKSKFAETFWTEDEFVTDIDGNTIEAQGLIGKTFIVIKEYDDNKYATGLGGTAYIIEFDGGLLIVASSLDVERESQEVIKRNHYL